MRKRTIFANDPYELWAVSGSANTQKGAKSAYQWLPPRKSFRCTYIARQIGIMSKYKLHTTLRNKDFMREYLQLNCPAQKIPKDRWI